MEDLKKTVKRSKLNLYIFNLFKFGFAPLIGRYFIMGGKGITI